VGSNFRQPTGKLKLILEYGMRGSGDGAWALNLVKELSAQGVAFPQTDGLCGPTKRGDVLG